MSAEVFRCGHPRSDENTRRNGRNRECRTCYRAWENDYRKRTNRSEKEKLRYLCKKHGLIPPKTLS